MSSARGHVDYVLLAAVGLLLVLGAQMVYSSSVVVAHNEFGNETHFFTRQLIWIALGLVGMGVVATVDYHRWQSVSLLLLLFTVVALVLVLIPQLATRQYGSARWLQVGPLPSFQPSEVAKLVVCIYMADWLSRKGTSVGKLSQGSIPFVIILGIIAGLVVVEPDMGTAVIICAVAFSVFWVAGANLLHLTFGFIPGGIGLIWYVTHAAAYRIERYQAYLDPHADPLGKGWQTIQTFIALGSGGLTGVGLGLSRQKAYYLPNAHTDSILAIIGEELGLVGTLAVIALLMVIGWRGLRIAVRAPDPFGRLLAVGLTSKVLWQAIVNIGAVTNSLPYTGVTLPFVSYGGNSLCISLIGIGLLLSVSRSARPSAAVARPGGTPPDAPRRPDRTPSFGVPGLGRRAHA